MSYAMISNQCSCGGRCLSVEYTDRVGELAKKHGLKLHIDGARIFNASVVSKRIFNMLIYEYCSKLEHALLYHPSVD
jgi:threonine aldolase